MRRDEIASAVGPASRWAIAALCCAALGLTACASPPDPGPLLGAGCHDSSSPGLPDIEYAHESPGVGIGWGFEHESGWSEDGSCTGETYMIAALVRAADEGAAIRACDRLGFRLPDPARLIDRGYAVDPFVWDCMNYPWPLDG